MKLPSSSFNCTMAENSDTCSDIQETIEDGPGVKCDMIVLMETSNCDEENKSESVKMAQSDLGDVPNLRTVAQAGALDERPVMNPAIRVKMLARVAVSNAHFKHQQRGEPDLTLDDKIEIAQDILDKSKITFLSKFWNYLELEDLEIFQDSRHVYEVDFYIKQIMKSKNKGFQRNRTKNRRYEAMKELISGGEYFSEEEMKFREPYLYDQMVGQYLTDDEIRAKVDKSDLTFSNILLKHIDQLDENVRFGHAKDVEDGQDEESEEEEEESEDIHMDMEHLDETESDDGNPKISEERKQELKAEFLTLMQEKFLQGDDKNFDYSKVDSNDAYDDLVVLNADAEEKYFDDEDPESIHSDSQLVILNDF